VDEVRARRGLDHENAAWTTKTRKARKREKEGAGLVLLGEGWTGE